MSIRSKLRSQLVKLLVSEKTQSAKRSFAEKRRKLSRRPHTISVFLELDDPYSYLLAQYLPSLAENYDVELRYFLTQAHSDEAHRPYADMLAVYAERDCARLAAELGVPFLDKGRAPPVEHRRALIDALAANRNNPDFDDELLVSMSLYWRGDSEGVARRVSGAELSGEGDRLLAENRQRLIELGHYNCATLHYEGEWYWGVDRLHYLVARLDGLGARRESASLGKLASIRQVMQMTLPIAPPSTAKDLPPLEFFYSFRSPYSYLSLGRVFAIADAFGLRVNVRPVLPMVMRGLQVPKSKLIYFANDTSREAQRMNIPYGKFADPIGKGVERCLAVFFYAQGEKRERDFLLNAGEAIWARGVDVATDKGMRKVTGRTGLFWPDVVAAMQDDAWRPIVDANRESMMDSGCWGVPTMRLGDFVVWGQDRGWLLARHIEELCEAGDGILV
ncbi:MAG: DsbA family protein [Gammaproteobacteria bacterium]|nr:DsbA family protein [Gammaproteobacteria bacterium]MDH3805869.1 DsbA family protein [Gammaproteobacteria bacterium]